MNDWKLRNQLLTACAFAKVFLEAADEELRGAPSDRREECVRQLQAILERLEESNVYSMCESELLPR